MSAEDAPRFSEAQIRNAVARVAANSSSAEGYSEEVAKADGEDMADAVMRRLHHPRALSDEQLAARSNAPAPSRPSTPGV